VVRRWEGLFGALASPVALLTAYVGQNGFLTAGLFGGFLYFLPRRPILSGIILGLLTYKPQFGILIPLVLFADRRWETLCSAGITAIAAVVASILLFGTASYLDFLHALPVVSHSYLKLGGEGWPKIQSIYSAARFLGAGDHAAWILQALSLGISALVMIRLWRGDVAFPLKAAGLIAATMLSIPYLHEYDFPLLIVGVAFLYRHGPFDRIEWMGIAAVNILIAASLAQLAPLGPITVVLVAAMTMRRILRTHSNSAARGAATVAAAA
jgi:hypothetical protein